MRSGVFRRWPGRATAARALPPLGRPLRELGRASKGPRGGVRGVDEGRGGAGAGSGRAPLASTRRGSSAASRNTAVSTRVGRRCPVRPAALAASALRRRGPASPLRSGNSDPRAAACPRRAGGGVWSSDVMDAAPFRHSCDYEDGRCVSRPAQVGTRTTSSPLRELAPTRRRPPARAASAASPPACLMHAAEAGDRLAAAAGDRAYVPDRTPPAPSTARYERAASAQCVRAETPAPRLAVCLGPAHICEHIFSHI